MMSLIRDLYHHHDWANEQIWRCVAALTDTQFNKPLAYSIGSVAEQLFHIAYWESYWFQSLQAGDRVSREALPQRTDYATRDALRELYADNKRLVWAVLDDLTPDDLERELTTTMTVGQLLMQMYGHALDHRAQIFAALHDFGAPTAEQTYIFYRNQRNQ